MERRLRAGSAMLSLFIALSSAAGGTDDGTVAASFYSVAVYDKQRDPSADLAATVDRAAREDKRILLFVGGDWCRWCKVFERTVLDNPAVRAAVTAGFVVMKVDYSRWGRRGRFLRAYPKARGFPHFHVLEKDGSWVHTQSRGSLETPDGATAYDAETVLAFVERWTAGDAP